MARRWLAAPSLFILIVAVYVMLGLADGGIGTAWPTIRDGFGRTDSSFGLISVALSGGYLIAGVASGHVTDRIGTVPTIITGVAVSTVGLGLLAISPVWWVVLAGFAGVGLGNGLGDASGNTWVALTLGPRHMGMLHAAYGLGASAGPLMMSVFIVVFDWWRGSFALVALIQLVLLGLLLRSRATDAPTTQSRAFESLESRVSAPGRVTIQLIVWFALYVGVEVATGQWAFTLLTEDRSTGDGFAAAITAGFWIGMTAGRLGLAAIGNRINPERLLWEASLLAIAAGALLWADPLGAGLFAIPIMGLAFSVMFPLAMGRTPHYLGSERTSRVVGYQLAGSAIGAITLPALIGVLADTHGIAVAPPAILATIVVMTLLWGVIRRETRVSPAAL